MNVALRFPMRSVPSSRLPHAQPLLCSQHHDSNHKIVSLLGDSQDFTAGAHSERCVRLCDSREGRRRSGRTWRCPRGGPKRFDSWNRELWNIEHEPISCPGDALSSWTSEGHPSCGPCHPPHLPWAPDAAPRHRALSTHRARIIQFRRDSSIGASEGPCVRALRCPPRFY